MSLIDYYRSVFESGSPENDGDSDDGLTNHDLVGTVQIILLLDINSFYL